MNVNAVNAAISSRSTADLVDWNDYGVNVLRDLVAEGAIIRAGRPATRSDLPALLAEERERVFAAAADKGAISYLRARRTGSEFRLSRRARFAVYAAVACRAALRGTLPRPVETIVIRPENLLSVDEFLARVGA